jgi:hypothetical protein
VPSLIYNFGFPKNVLSSKLIRFLGIAQGGSSIDRSSIQKSGWKRIGSFEKIRDHCCSNAIIFLIFMVTFASLSSPFTPSNSIRLRLIKLKSEILSWITCPSKNSSKDFSKVLIFFIFGSAIPFLAFMYCTRIYDFFASLEKLRKCSASRSNGI